MVKLTLPFSQDGKVGKSVLTTVALQPGSWDTVVGELRAQHPSVAERIFTSSGRMAAGFALVLNDDVVHAGHPPSDLRSGDELYVIVTIAGG